MSVISTDENLNKYAFEKAEKEYADTEWTPELIKGLLIAMTLTGIRMEELRDIIQIAGLVDSSDFGGPNYEWSMRALAKAQEIARARAS